ncbi:MAG: hypothetical protein AAFR60_05745 [Pseudomonadota bacterium]
MTKPSDDFLGIEIDPIDLKLEATARRKRIPTLKLEHSDGQSATANGNQGAKSEEMGGAQFEREPLRSTTTSILGPEPVDLPGRPKSQMPRKRPMSLEVPDYLARELKVKAAAEAVTVRYLILNALAASDYRIDDDELEEDGRRLR